MKLLILFIILFLVNCETRDNYTTPEFLTEKIICVRLHNSNTHYVSNTRYAVKGVDFDFSYDKPSGKYGIININDVTFNEIVVGQTFNLTGKYKFKALRLEKCGQDMCLYIQRVFTKKS